MLESGGSLRRSHADLLGAVLQNGRRVGVHVTATAPGRTGVPSSLGSAFGRRVILRMTSQDDYLMLGAPHGILDAESPAGAALLGKHPAQLSTIGGAGSPRARGALPAGGGRPRASRCAARPAWPPAMPTRCPSTWSRTPQRDDVCVGVDGDLATACMLPLLPWPAARPLSATGSQRHVALRGLAGLQVARRTGPTSSALRRGRARSRPPGVDVAVEPPPWSHCSRVSSAARSRRTVAGRILLVDDVHQSEGGWERRRRRPTSSLLAQVVERARSCGCAVVVAADSDRPGPAARRRSGRGRHVARRAVLLSPEPPDRSLVGGLGPHATRTAVVGVGRACWSVPGLVQLSRCFSRPPTGR